MDEKKWEPSGIVWGSDPEEIQDTEEAQDTAGFSPQEPQDTAGPGPQDPVPATTNFSPQDSAPAGPSRVPRPAFRSRGAAKKRSPLKTIGIVILVLFVLSTISRACGRKDTASEPKQTPAATEESATEQSAVQSDPSQPAQNQPQTEQSGASTQPQEQKEDRNGYLPATNGKFSFAGVEFGIPSYFKKSEREEQTEVFFYANDPAGKNFEAQLVFSSKLQENLPEDLIEKQGDSIQENLVKNFGTEPEVLMSENVTLLGQPARHVIVHTSIEGQGVIENIVFLLRPQKDGLLVIILTNLDNSYYDYTNDFYKILNNAVIEEAAEPEQATEEPASTGDLDSDFKKMMDDYEAFFDSYAEFMKKFAETDDTTALLSDYFEFLTQYTEMMGELDALDTDDMSEAEYAYYVEVMGRISKKLLEVAQ